MKKLVLTPPASILQDKPETNTTEPVQDISPIINSICPVELVKIITSPQNINYLYNFINCMDSLKLTRLEKILTVTTGKQVTITSPCPCANFTVSIPRNNRDIIPFKKCLLTKSFDNATGLSFIAGKDQNNLTRCYDLATLPHLLIAGATGSGKSVVLNNIICSLLYKNTPETLSFIMIDCKRVELSQYNPLPHLFMPVITTPEGAKKALVKALELIQTRYKILEKKGLKTGNFTRLIIVIDELADLILQGKTSIEPLLIRIAQIGRACNVHLILATQKPSASIITGLLAANIPGKICLKCSRVQDSITIIGHKGGERLTGAGDCIIKTPDTTSETRLQAPYISGQDIQSIVQYWKKPDKVKRAG